MDLLIAPGTVDAAHADKAPATGTPGWATDGNPATGTPATLWPAYAFNAMQEELSTVIKQAGISLSRGDNTQLHAAINALINKQQSPNDATAGRALTVGNAFGIGAVNHLNQVDLDTVRTSGLYSQWNSSWATIASHYPVAGISGTGSLVVVASGNGDTVTQQYTTFADAQTYTRACALGTWGNWKRTVTSDEFTGSSKQLLADNGYQKLPGGLILQWGVQASAASGNTSAFFPIAFPGGTLAVFGTGLNTAGGIQAYVTLNSYTNGGATFNCFYAPSGTAPSLVSTVNGVSLRWFALGKA
ncbi:pyocin knob domain-containing protein [Achromobacter sp. AONIH1]|uniref:pyocin knob domain-containing protein n=1 Tax=Achromobacter sp. AONIH1 TaxID=1758194 RepID=UPI0018F82F5A|nr:pyocin knob domain-containing protein [Achromobacter sp. AONIH1]